MLPARKKDGREDTTVQEKKKEYNHVVAGVKVSDKQWVIAELSSAWLRGAVLRDEVGGEVSLANKKDIRCIVDVKTNIADCKDVLLKNVKENPNRCVVAIGDITKGLSFNIESKKASFFLFCSKILLLNLFAKKGQADFSGLSNP